MKVSCNWLQSYFDKPLPTPQTLADLFTFHSFEVEGIEKMTAQSDTILDIKVLPDRAHYCLCHRGIALEVSMLTGLSLSLTPLFTKQNVSATAVDFSKIVPIDKTVAEPPRVVIKDPSFCRRFSIRRIENVTVAPAPAWLAQCLTSIGQRTINGIVDATNFTMFDMGQPMHAFDADKLKGDIVVRRAQEGEKITLLDGREITLTADDSVLSDDNGALDIAGVKGGRRAEVTASTKNIVMTVANFEPTAVRCTSTKYNLRNESSRRYENEITPEWTMDGMNRVSALIAALVSAGAISAISPQANQTNQAKMGEIKDIYPTKPLPVSITTTHDAINKRLGVEISVDKCDAILKGFGIDFALGNKQENKKVAELDLAIPPYRLDLTIPEDIAEEVGRIYGYDKIKGILPPKLEGSSNAFSAKVNSTVFVCEKIKDILVREGFSEVYLYTLAPKGDVEVAYPLASDKSALRTNLTDALTHCVEMNAHNADLLDLETIKIFEIGNVFNQKTQKEVSKEGGKQNSTETLRLALVATQVKKVKGLTVKKVIDDVVAILVSELGVDLPVLNTAPAGNLGNTIEIDLTSLVAQMQAKNLIPDSYAGIDRAKKADFIYKPFSVYPFIVRDIAVFVLDAASEAKGTNNTDGVVWSEIEKGIEDADAISLVARKGLFDVFTKEMSDGSKKTSYAFRIVFQAFDRTLSDVEVNGIMEKIYARMKAKNWEVR